MTDIPEKLNSTNIGNMFGLIQKYMPTLFEYVSEKQFHKFIEKSWRFVQENDGQTKSANFLSAMFELAKEHQEKKSFQTRGEFLFFNSLLVHGVEMGMTKGLRPLVNSAVQNHENQSILHVGAELAICLWFAQDLEFIEYETILSNGKQCDFRFSDNEGKNILLEVYNMEIDISRYDKESFEKFYSRRIQSKFTSKTTNLQSDELRSIVIAPVVHGFTKELLIEQKKFLCESSRIVYDKLGISTTIPYSFAQVGKYPHRLYRVDELYEFL